MTIQEFNQLSRETAQQELFKCCGSTRWATALAGKRPFDNREALIQSSDEIWKHCERADGLEAFTHHPKIGDIKSLEKKFASTKEWAGKEQSGVESADIAVLEALSEGNRAYEKKYGYIFIVCASGKSAAEMLDLLQARMSNAPEDELKVAMSEQNKITRLRLLKLIP